MITFGVLGIGHTDLSIYALKSWFEILLGLSRKS